MPPDICPQCGAEVPPHASACPECGSDEQTGWSETAYADNLGLPDEEFNYNEFVKEEFGTGKIKPHGVGWLWWIVAVLLLVAMLFFLYR